MAQPEAISRPPTSRCSKHASAQFRPLVPADRHRARRFCTSRLFHYDPSASPASDGSINRYYDPATGQFVTVDPEIAQTGTAYGYVNDNPLNGTDPLGLWSLNPFHDVAEAARDAAGGVAKGAKWAYHNPEEVGLIAGGVALAASGVGLGVDFGYIGVVSGVEAETIGTVADGVATAAQAIPSALDTSKCISDANLYKCSTAALDDLSLGTAFGSFASDLGLYGDITPVENAFSGLWSVDSGLGAGILGSISYLSGRDSVGHALPGGGWSGDTFGC